MELPIDNIDIGIGAMYRSMFHRQPLVNGYSGHFPPHYSVLSLSLWRGDVIGHSSTWPGGVRSSSS